VGPKRAEYSPVKACIINRQMQVEKVTWECLARPWTKGGIFLSGGEVRIELVFGQGGWGKGGVGGDLGRFCCRGFSSPK
jgi:hypothetical protein